jgi:hypothetical protein
MFWEVTPAVEVYRRFGEIFCILLQDQEVRPYKLVVCIIGLFFDYEDTFN